MGILQSRAPTPPPMDTCRGEMSRDEMLSPLGRFWLVALTLPMGEELRVPAKAQHGAGWPDLQIGYGAALCEAPLGNNCLPLHAMSLLTLAHADTLLLRNKCTSVRNEWSRLCRPCRQHPCPEWRGATGPWVATACRCKVPRDRHVEDLQWHSMRARAGMLLAMQIPL